MYLYSQSDRNYKLLQNTTLCIFSVWREYNSYRVKRFRSCTLAHLESLYLWRSRHRCFTHMFCSTKQSHLSAVQSCAPAPEWIPAGPFCQGLSVSKPPPADRNAPKSSGCTSVVMERDSLSPVSEFPFSALTLWFAGRAAQKSLQKSVHQPPDLAVHGASGALTAGNSPSLQVTHFTYTRICSLRAAERSGLTAVLPGFKFPCKTYKYLLLTSSLLS